MKQLLDERRVAEYEDLIQEFKEKNQRHKSKGNTGTSFTCIWANV